MHGVSTKLLFQAILALFRRPTVDRRVDRLAATRMSSTSRHSAASTVPPMLHEAKAPLVTIAKKRRIEGTEWPETQPWCHQ